MTKRRLPLVPADERAFSYSEIDTFNACPMRHHLKYRERLVPEVVPSSLRIGRAYHKGVEAGMVAGTAPGVAVRPGHEVADRVAAATAAAIHRADEDCDTQLRAIEAAGMTGRLTPDAVDAALITAVEERADLRWMLQHYFEVCADDFDALVPLAIERKYLVPVPRIDGRGGALHQKGVIDLAFFDRHLGDIVVHDHKTIGDGNLRDVERRAELDPQMAGYVQAIRQLQKGGDLVPIAPGIVSAEDIRNAKTGRVVYSVIRRARPQAPHVNEDGTVSTRKCDTDPETYRAALVEAGDPPKLRELREQVVEAERQDAAAGSRRPLTDKLVAKLDEAEKKWAAKHEEQEGFLQRLAEAGDRFFARTEVIRTDEEIERWRSDFFVASGRIREADRSPSARTRNASACSLPWSPRCEYRGPCIDPENRAGFTVKPKAEATAENGGG